MRHFFVYFPLACQSADGFVLFRRSSVLLFLVCDRLHFARGIAAVFCLFYGEAAPTFREHAFIQVTMCAYSPQVSVSKRECN